MERCVHKYLYNYVVANNKLTSYQSGFIKGESTVNQLTYIYNDICKALDDGKEVRAVFCDISKALTEFGTEDCFTNSHLSAFMALYCNGSLHISLSEANAWYTATRLLAGLRLTQAFLKDPYWDLFYSLSISMT